MARTENQQDGRDGAEAAWAGERFVLLPQRAVYWRARGVLLVADLHLGKADHFRAAGIPAPDTASATLHRLGAALDATGAGELIILGDLFHARGGVTPSLVAAVQRWREARAGLRITVIPGNHDRHAGPPPDCLDMACAGEDMELGGLLLRHHPEPVPGRFVVAGHVHPAVRMHNTIGHGLRLPCFHLGPRVFTLPAFGDFTGSHVIRPRVGDQVFAVGPDTVIDIMPAPIARASSPPRPRPRRREPSA